MALPNKSVVEQILTRNGRGEKLRRSISDAWETVAKKYPDRFWFRRKATHAGLIWEYSVENAMTMLEADAGVHPVAHLDTMSFIFDDKVLVRLKKADLQLRSRNYPTFLATMFHEHGADLFGYEGLQRVEAAYVQNRFGTDIDWIGIVAREGKQLLWEFELEKFSAPIERLPLPEASGPAATRVMRPKASADENRKDKDREDGGA